MRLINNNFKVDFNKANGAIEGLRLVSDSTCFNWVESRNGYGIPYGNAFLLKSETGDNTIKLTYQYFSELQLIITRELTVDGMVEQYSFVNNGKDTLHFTEGELGIFMPFNDSFDTAEVSLMRRCHSHIWCGGNTAYIYNLRMNGDNPNVGLVMTKGYITSYGIEKTFLKGDRGDFVMLLPETDIPSGGSVSLDFLVFYYSSYEDFEEIVRDKGGCICTADCYTPEVGDSISVTAYGANSVVSGGVTYKIEGGKCDVVINDEGEQRIVVNYSDKQTFININAFSKKEKLPVRAKFAVNNQMVKSGRLEGAFLSYDNANCRTIYKAGRRSRFNTAGCHPTTLLAIVRGVNAGILNKNDYDDIIDKSMSFYDRELIKGGEIADDIGKRRVKFAKKYYTYPLFVAIKLEYYKYSGDINSLVQAAVIMKNYYSSGAMYELTPVFPLIREIRRAGENALADELQDMLTSCADDIINNGCKYANVCGLMFSHQIVTAASAVLCDAFALTGKQYYLMNAREHLAKLMLFDGIQPDFRLNSVAVIYHSDKLCKKAYGDETPHFINSDSALAYYKYYKVTNDVEFLNKAKRNISACLTLFDKEGKGNRSHTEPLMVNGIKSRGYEQISGGEDIIMYYYSLIFAE